MLTIGLVSLDKFYKFKLKKILMFYFYHLTGWSFILACIGAVSTLIAASCFLTEASVQHRKRSQMKESQSKFEMEHETKA